MEHQTGPQNGKEKALDNKVILEERVSPEAEKRETRLSRKAEKERKNAEDLVRVVTAARAVIAALRQYGICCAIFGSLACRLYSKFRNPNDVDLLTIQPPDAPYQTAEDVKSFVVETNPDRFYLKLPRNPEAPYRILYYRSETGLEDCKVDIIMPGTMYLPNLFQPSLREQIVDVSGIPLVPFSLLLLHKLQGWADHRASPEKHKRRKQTKDASDVRHFFRMEMKIDVLRRTRPWGDKDLFCGEFQELTRLRVKEYCAKYHSRYLGWKQLGFETA